MLTGLFFGSFNPIHIGHMALAEYMLGFTPIEQIWFVVSPHNPLKKKESLLADHHRLEMVHLAVDHDPRFRVSDIEFRMPQPSYTIDTLTYLEEKYPDRKFSLIIGSDNLETFHKWKNASKIIEKYHRFVYPRHSESDEIPSLTENLSLVNAPRIEISSSFIRQAIKEGKSIRYFLPEKVFKYVDEMNFYKK
ncbi:MAG: nicotinate-nucleotide adenylyltransferase [Bacteroidales bacterium]|nr:nicotinate-nucleotide adenylyltransferase [Bacteroidales bacterium]